MSFAKELKNLGFTTGLGMLARMATGASPREAIRTAGTSAIMGEFLDNEETAHGIAEAVNVIAKQRQIAKTIDRPVAVGYNTVGVSFTEDEYAGAQMDLLNLIRQADFGKYDGILDAIIDGLVEVKIAIRQMKDADENPDVSMSAEDLL